MLECFAALPTKLYPQEGHVRPPSQSRLGFSRVFIVIIMRSLVWRRLEGNMFPVDGSQAIRKVPFLFTLFCDL